jgi:hypothetical protein
MAGNDRSDRRPLEVLGVLVTIGAIVDSRGQLVLRRLKWLASRTAAPCLLVATFTLLLPAALCRHLVRDRVPGRLPVVRAVVLRRAGEVAHRRRD